MADQTRLLRKRALLRRRPRRLLLLLRRRRRQRDGIYARLVAATATAKGRGGRSGRFIAVGGFDGVLRGGAGGDAAILCRNMS
jgi:hypothetical protein